MGAALLPGLLQGSAYSQNAADARRRWVFATDARRRWIFAGQQQDAVFLKKIYVLSIRAPYWIKGLNFASAQTTHVGGRSGYARCSVNAGWPYLETIR